MINADEIIKSERKTFSIRIDKNGRVIVRAPKRAKDKDIEKVLLSSQQWIQKQLNTYNANKDKFFVEVNDLEKINLLGREYFFFFFDGKSRIENGIIFINGSRDKKEEFRKALKDFANVYLKERVKYFESLTGLHPSQIKMSWSKTRWGSCSSKGVVSLSVYLMLCEKDEADYVILHELCHLEHLDHSPDFWALVGKYMPDYKEKRKALRDKRWLTEAV